MNFNKLHESYVNNKNTFEGIQAEMIEIKLSNTGFNVLPSVLRLKQLEDQCKSPTLAQFVKKKLSRPFFTPKITRVFCVGDSINVRFLQLDQSRALQVVPSETLTDVCVRYGIDIGAFWYTIRGKPVRIDVALCEYGIHEGCDIIANERLRGGSSTFAADYRLYTHIRDCERQVLRETLPRFALQGDALTAEQNVMSSVMMTLVSVKETLFEGHETLFETLENFFQIVYWFRKCDNMRDYTVMVALAHKLMTGKSASSRLMQIFGFKSELQGEFTEFVKQMRDLYTTTHGMIGKDSLLSKVRRIYTYLLVQGVLTPVGIKLTEEQFLALEAKTRYEVSDHTSMVFTIFDVAITICERIDAYFLTGDLRAWFTMISYTPNGRKKLIDFWLLVPTPPIWPYMVQPTLRLYQI